MTVYQATTLALIQEQTTELWTKYYVKTQQSKVKSLKALTLILLMWRIG
jgi:hypothetical protein